MASRNRSTVWIGVFSIFAAGGTPWTDLYAAPIVFVGTDVNLTDEVPLTAHPIADGARERFLSQLTQGQYGIQDFDDLPVDYNVSESTLMFANSEITANVTDTYAVSLLQLMDTSDWGRFTGKYAVTGAQYLLADTEADTPYFTLEFSAPVTALGFYVADANDSLLPGEPSTWGLQVRLIDEFDQVVDVFSDDRPGLGSLANASASFVGIVSPDCPFVAASFWSTGGIGDEGIGIDSVTVGSAVPEPPAATLFVLALLALRWHSRSTASEKHRTRIHSSGLTD
jgi:hypothetical protein